MVDYVMLIWLKLVLMFQSRVFTKVSDGCQVIAKVHMIISYILKQIPTTISPNKCFQFVWTTIKSVCTRYWPEQW